jgi:hypothetical protein
MLSRMATFPPPAPIQAVQPFLPRLPERARPIPPPTAIAAAPEPPPAPETAPEPLRQPGEIPSLDGGIIASLIARAGLVIVAFLIAQRFQQASRAVADQQLVRASTTLDSLDSITFVGLALVILAVGAAGWLAHQVDVSASRLAKFHKPGSWLAALAPLLLLPLFQFNEHVDLEAGRIDFRPGVTAIMIVVLLWLPASRIKSAVAATGTKLPFRGQAELDLIAIGFFWAAWSRTRLAPTDQLRAAELSRIGHMVMIAAVVGLVGALTAAALMIRTRRVILGAARDAAAPEQASITSFVIHAPSSPVRGPTRAMIPTAPWRWALLAAYGIWIASHLVSAVIYLQIRGLLDVRDSADRIDRQVAMSVVANGIGFGFVFIAQWAWVIVTVCNANRATVSAPSIAMTWAFAAVPIGTIAISVFLGGAAGGFLFAVGILLVVPSYFLSFKMASSAVASVGGDMMSIRTWSLAIWLWVAIQYFGIVMRPPTVQQVLMLGIATAVVRAAALVVVVRTAHRVTAAADLSMKGFHQVKRR